jgi:hypothetical protein
LKFVWRAISATIACAFIIMIMLRDDRDVA